MSEGQRLAAELAASLRATGRYDVTALVRSTGYSYGHVWKVLNGRERPSVACVEALRRAAGRIPAGSVDERRRYPPSGFREAVELARVLRRTGRYNVSEIARRAGHPRATVSRVLNGRQGVSVYLVEDLALAAGVDLAYLYA